MINWLKRFHVTSIRERSKNSGDTLTDDELAYMSWAFLNDKKTCPDCREGDLVRGPEGGCSMNGMCNNCTSEFNLTFLPGGVIIGERNGDAGAGDPERVTRVYGIMEETR